MPRLILTVTPQWYSEIGEPLKFGTPQQWVIPEGINPMRLNSHYIPAVFISQFDSREYGSYKLEFRIAIHEDGGDALGTPKAVENENM